MGCSFVASSAQMCAIVLTIVLKKNDIDGNVCSVVAMSVRAGFVARTLMGG